MKKIISVLFIVLNFYIVLNSISLKEVWTINGLDVPESAVYYPSEDVIFVSNINGEPYEKDKNGYISKIKPNGKVIDKKWIATLDAPKGMAIYDDKLFVSDINQLVIIDIKKSQIVQRIQIEDADFLNDVSVDLKGNIYISDSSSNPGVIYKFSNGQIVKWIISEKIKRPNGLLIDSNYLYVGSFADGNLNKINLNTKDIIFAGKFINAIDGITKIDSTYFALSNWFNKIVFVKDFIQSFEIKLNYNCADILYLKDEKIMLVPGFYNNKLVAYKIKI